VHLLDFKGVTRTIKPCIVWHHVLYKVYFKIHYPPLIIVVDSTTVTLGYATAWFGFAPYIRLGEELCYSHHDHKPVLSAGPSSIDGNHTSVFVALLSLWG